MGKFEEPTAKTDVSIFVSQVLAKIVKRKFETAFREIRGGLVEVLRHKRDTPEKYWYFPETFEKAVYKRVVVHGKAPKCFLRIEAASKLHR